MVEAQVLTGVLKRGDALTVMARHCTPALAAAAASGYSLAHVIGYKTRRPA